MSFEKIAFVGAGNMAAAIVGRLVRAGVAPEKLQASDPNPERRASVSASAGIEVVADNDEMIRNADVVVLAVKPQVLAGVLAAARPAFRADQLVVSICAGVSLSSLATLVPDGVRLARVMPNTPALVGQGVSAIALGPGVSTEQATCVRRIFEAVGDCVTVDERYMNAVTGLSGSGPAYVMLMIEALADGGVQAGLPRELAMKLATQTVLGAATWLKETGEHPGQLKDRVASPGGTTIAGVYALERGGLRAVLMDAVVAAATRAAELDT